MLVHDFAGKGRSYRIVACLVLLVVTLAIFAQATHFHSSAESASTSRCSLCEIVETSLPVLVASPVAVGRITTTIVNTVSVADAQEPVEGSNLSVRPPPVQ